MCQVRNRKRTEWPTSQINTRTTCRENSTWTISALTVICAGRRPRPISGAMRMEGIPMSSSSPRRRRKKLDAGRRWRDAQSKRSGTTAKVECERTRTMNVPTKPMRRAGEPEAPARFSVPGRFRRLKWNEAVSAGNFVVNGSLGLQPWQGPGGFRAGSSARRIYLREEPERFRPAATRAARRNAKHL